MSVKSGYSLIFELSYNTTSSKAINLMILFYPNKEKDTYKMSFSLP